MKLHLALILFFIATSSLSLANEPNVRFRRIPKEDLKQTSHPLDPEAEAAILYQSCRRSITYNRSVGFQLRTRLHQRIKIYTQDGQSWGDFDIPYSKDAQFARFRAYTYNLEDGKEVEIRLNNRDIYTEDVSQFTNLRRFAMPGVVAGSIIDIDYEIVEPARSSFQPFIKQHTIPVDYSEYIVDIPEYFIFNRSTKGLPLIMDIQNSEYNEGETFIDSSGNSYRVTFKVSRDNYIAHNVPALRPEPFVPSMSNYQSAITYELSELHPPHSRTISFSRTWGDIVRSLMEDRNFGGQITTRIRETESFLAEITDLPEIERIEKIYYYVRDNHEWNGNYGELAQNGVRNLLSERTGNIGDINLLLLNMLKSSNIDAKPVVMSSRNNGFLNLAHPTYQQLNYLIIAIQREENMMLLDATDKNMLVGYLPLRALNLDGILIESSNSGKRIEIENPNKGSKQTIAIIQLNDDLTINCTARLTYLNHSSIVKRSQIRSHQNEEEYIKSLMDKHPSIDITSYNVEGLKDISNQVVETFEFTSNGYIEQIGDMLYISPLLLWQTDESPFKSEKREFAVFYPDAGIETYLITFQTPEGYKIESTPQPVQMILPENIGSMLYNISISDNTIQIHYRYIRNETIVSPSNYEYLRDFMIHKIEKQNERIVLRKI
ncbi:DUF3857 domain-containing protein [Alkalitalea saponilacus]|uniref:DUF3857 domain-containing protein n=1 Tax=Alkalitalea saponilacus TaxID=889453 RepID=A0A1T5CEV0_9BACT|nr:DUF3857 domain-containing protein [Alkalitalea saponilacus]ASB49848.1 hypothetical protein CDL62_12235 [Alkalitalea saponilacus]SKB58008.1 protein of unknown function [Alkalitalea saponilacus]